MLGDCRFWGSETKGRPPRLGSWLHVATKGNQKGPWSRRRTGNGRCRAVKTNEASTIFSWLCKPCRKYEESAQKALAETKYAIDLARIFGNTRGEGFVLKQVSKTKRKRRNNKWCVSSTKWWSSVGFPLNTTQKGVPSKKDTPKSGASIKRMEKASTRPPRRVGRAGMRLHGRAKEDCTRLASRPCMPHTCRTPLVC